MDRVLDRLVEFDEKSRAYPIRTLLGAGKKPRSYTWRCNEWFDQGREGACVAFAFGHELAARPAEVKGITNEFLVKLYHRAQQLDAWPGGSYPGYESHGSFYEGTSVLGGIKAVQEITGKILEYRWAFGRDEVIETLGYFGPVVLGVPWYEGMFSPDENGIIHPTGQIAGGHAILARGVDIKKQLVILRNSWGREWGMNGDCYITFEGLTKLLEEQGEACIAVIRARETPIPRNKRVI